MVKLLLFLSLFSLLLSTGCAHRPEDLEKAPSPLERVGEVQNHDVDHDCSYFYFLWGRYAEITNQLDAALEAYEKAAICDPGSGYISRKIPVMLLRLGRLKEAATHIQAFLTQHPDAPGIRMLLAKLYIKNQDDAGAEKQYRLVHQRHPEEVQALLLLAQLYLRRENIDAARTVLQEVLTVSADDYPAQVLLARIFAREQNIAEAKRYYEKSLVVNWSADLALEAGELYLRNKRYVDAEAQYKQILSREGQNEDAGLGLVQVYLDQGKKTAALGELRRLKEQTTHPARIELAMARLYAQERQYGKAADILEKFLKEDDRPRVRYLLGLIYFQWKKYPQALEHLQQIPQDGEQFEDSVFLQVRLLRLLHRPEEAILVLEEAVTARTVDNLDLYILLATLDQEQGREDRGRQVYVHALALHPDDPELLYEFGLFLEQAGRRSEAMEVMGKVLVLEPDNASALNFIGYAWAENGEHLEQALKYVSRAVALKPENGSIRDSLGWVYFRLGDLDKAQRELKRALVQTDSDPAVLEHLGDVYVQGGQVSPALKVYRKALRKYTKESDKAEVREKIQAIKK